METEKNKKTAPKKSRVKKLLLLIAAVLVGLVLLVILIIPAYVSSEKARLTILSKINDSVDGEADFAGLSMNWFKGLTLTDLSFRDSAGTTSVTVKEISARPRYASILTGSIAFGKTVIDQPDIEINLSPRSPQKPSTSAPAAAVEPSAAPQVIVLPVEKINLIVNDGRLKITDPDDGTTELTAINSKVNLNPPGKKTDFNLSAILLAQAKQSNIRAAGEITTDKKNPWRLEGSTGDLTVEVNDLNLGSLASVFAVAGIDIQAAGELSANLNAALQDGKLKALTGFVKAANLDITAPALKGDRLKTSTLELDAKIKTENKLINIDKLHLKTDWAVVNAAGTAPATYESFQRFLKPDTPYQLKADFNIDLAALAAQMPTTLAIKEDTRLTSGRLSGNVETTALQGQKKITARAEIENLAGTVGQKTASLTQPIKAAAEITSEKTGVKFDNVNISASFARLKCSGTAESIDYDADIDLAKLQADLGQFLDLGKYQLAGTVTESGSIISEKDTVNITGSAACQNIRLTSPEGLTAFEPAAQISYALAAETKQNFVNLNSLQADASFGQITIKDAAIPLNEKSQKPLKLDISADLDLQKLGPFIVLSGRLPKEAQLSGSARSDISLTQKNTLYNIYTDSTRIQNLKLTYPQKQPFEQSEISLILDADIDPAQKTFRLKKLKLESPQIKIPEAEFSKTNQNGISTLKGRAKLQYDWSAISTVASPYLPEGLALAGQRTDSVNFASQYPSDKPDQLMANLDTAARLGFEKAQYMGLDFGPTEFDLKVEKGLLNIAPFSTTVNNGKFNFAARADFNKTPTLITLPQQTHIIENINIDQRTTNQLLKYVNPIFANAVNVTGIANFQCESLAIPLSAANKNDLEVIGTISLTNVNMQAAGLLGKIISATGSSTEETLTVHPTRFVLKDGFLRYDNMQVDIGNDPVYFKGAIGLDNSLDMTITVPISDDQRINGKLGGTINNPELDLASLLQDQIKQQLEQQLRRGLDKWLKRD